MKTGRFWHGDAEGRIHCELCPHGCVLREGQTGLCRVRRAEGGEMKALGYGAVSSAHLDPIEKKPLYHFHPGAAIFSVGGWGCNFQCNFCQNWTISQQSAQASRRYRPEDVAAAAAADGSIGVAYTYNEPLIGLEFVIECARLAKGRGLANVLVTNGYVLPGPAAEMLALTDALNVDIKSMADSFYRQQCHGTLRPVLDFCCQAVKAGCHVEITNLLIPGLNDQERNLAALARWIKENLGERTPLHIGAYRPEYKSTIPATPVARLKAAYETCAQHLPYVYLGNVLMERGQDTLCPACGSTLVQRSGYSIRASGLKEGACAKCGRAADIVR